MKNRIKDIITFWQGTADEHMAAFAAQSAFFIFLSFFPIINILVSLPKLFPISEQDVLSIIYYVFPSSFENYVANLVDEMYKNSSNSITIISIMIAIWSAAKGLTAVRYGLNEVYRSRESRNYLIIRSISAVYTILFVVLVLFLIPLNMFGTQIALYTLNKFPNFKNVTLLVYSVRSSATFILLFIMFMLMYTIVPSKKMKFRKQLPGAVLAAFLWVCVTKLFSLYVDYYASKQYMYGSLTTVILLMFWMYFVIYFIFIGAQLNEYLHVCRKRNAEYELKRYQEAEGEVWDDDEIDQSSRISGSSKDYDNLDMTDNSDNDSDDDSDDDVEKMLSDLEQDINEFKSRRKTDRRTSRRSKKVVKFDKKQAR